MELLGVFEPPTPPMTDEELDAFAEAVYDQMIDQLDRRATSDD